MPPIKGNRIKERIKCNKRDKNQINISSLSLPIDARKLDIKVKIDKEKNPGKRYINK